MLLSNLLLLTFLPFALAAKKEGDFAVTVNGKTYNPPEGDEIKLDKQNTPLTGLVLFRGIHVEFDFDTRNFALQNYKLTGAPDPLRMVTSPTVIFTNYSFGLPTSVTANARLDRLDVKDETAVIRINCAGGKFKIQAKDGPQGGILQTEPELDMGPVEMTRILGPNMFYFINEFTGKINFGNGIDADSTHEMLLGKDSPEAATQTYQDGLSSRWLIQPGGRVGTVFGEDAIEQGGAGSNCTSHCQNRNRIRGSLPVPPDPTNPTPLPPGEDD